MKHIFFLATILSFIIAEINFTGDARIRPRLDIINEAPKNGDSINDFPTLATRPRNTSFDNRKIKSAIRFKATNINKVIRSINKICVQWLNYVSPNFILTFMELFMIKSTII